MSILLKLDLSMEKEEMIRTGFVSNSSGSSFVVARRKDCTWEQIIKESGPMSDVAEDIIRWLAKECPQFQSIENIALYSALKDYSGKDAIEAVKEGEYNCITKEMVALVDDPENWLFASGYASYNESDDPIEVWVGYGGRIDGDCFKLRNVGN